MLNMDFEKTVIIDTEQAEWVPSPKAGVWRKPLAREEAEQGHATSIVKYEPGASFSPHDHPKGEEILVLDGTFSDATGDFSSGTYFRNPAGFKHAPFSKEGCLILVKLHQFQSRDNKRVSIDTNYNNFVNNPTNTENNHVLRLHSYREEAVTILFCREGQAVAPRTDENPIGRELFILSGAITEGSNQHKKGTWIRCAATDTRQWTAQKDSVIWFKSGHF